MSVDRRGEKYHGRLELTWTNKELRLLAHEDGSYEWLPAADYRVAEVRLLHDVDAVGPIASQRYRARDNLLIRGDALNALTSILELPEFEREYAGRVKLAYLDPPFNTQESFLQYDDNLEHSVWLTMMRDRLVQVQKLLAPNGSVWVHCDDREQHRLRCVMDEVFGTSSFVATVVWQKRPTRENRAAIGDVHDYIIVYSPLGQGWSEVRHRLPRDARSLRQYRNPNDDPRGAWRTVPLDAQAGHATAAQFYEIETPAGQRFSPAQGRAWAVTRTRYEELLASGRVYFGKDGRGRPMLIRYLDEDHGLVPWTWWPHDEVGHTGESKKEILDLFPEVEPFATPKPERLMHRIIHVATDPGDIVLDCFLGSGTTAAVAHKMERRWVGIEMLPHVFDTFALPRLERVVRGDDGVGISALLDWQGGRSFRILDLAPSMFRAEAGQVFLSEWATNGKLAEVTAAQLHYEYEYDPPFCGRRGRSRLAVIDGLVNDDVIRLLVTALPDNDRLVACGTAIDPASRDTLRTLRPGSTVRKIPQSILQEYRLAVRAKQPLPSPAAPASPPEPVAAT